MRGVRIGRSTNENEVVLLCPQAHNNLLPSSVSSQLDYYTSKVPAVVSMTLTAVEQTCASHWLPLASPSRRCLENTPDSDPQLALIHPKHAMPSRPPISITWKSVEEGAQILARVVVKTCYVCPGLPRRSRSYFNRFSLFAYRR